ncbi:protein Son [Culex pipiens pallens]|uniref:protein Son n=1 Tax=Culex pipiens pallens TaxID=42434 RepID=UPI0019539E37|nr:protein Son [Culex pipiens pallens]
MSENVTVKEEKSSPLPAELFPLNIKIKQEKTTDSSKSETVDKLSIDLNLTNIFSATTTTTTSNAGATVATTTTDDTQKETKSVEPLKSSNEILTELFKVFNAAPPEIIEDDSNDGEEVAGKKKKHKKHKKKSKKKKKNENGGSGSSSDSEPEEGEIKRKAKKIKKEKDKDKERDKSKRKKSKEKDKVKKEKVDDGGKKDERVSVKTEITSVVVKKEPRDDRYGTRETRERDDRYSSRDARDLRDGRDFRDSRDVRDVRDIRDSRDIRDAKDSYHHSHHHHHHHGSTSRDDHHPRIKQEKDDRSYRDSARDREKDRERERDREQRDREKEDPKSKPRIQIKSLKDSTIFKEAAAAASSSGSRERQRSRDRDRDRTTSEGRSKSREMHRRRRSDSDFSMSDEETYEEGKGRYYDFYQKKYNSFYASYRDEERSRKRKRSEDRAGDRYRKSRSKSRSRSPQFDKQKLLEIARKNAITMLKKGTLPGVQGLDKESKEKLIMKMKSSGKTIDELTNFCKKISEKENLNELSSVSSEDSDHDADGGSKAFHHPFQLKDHGPIVMNIKNSVPLQPKSAEQTKALLLQYPVSSGAQHRKMENEWVPVEPPTQAGPLVPLSRPEKATPKIPITASFVPQAEKQQPAYTPVNPPPGISPALCQPGPSSAPIPPSIDIPNALPAPPPSSNPIADAALLPEVFPSNPEGNKLDVSTIISNRLNAMRKLQDNPADAEAIKLLYNTQKDMSAWASSKFTPGQFLGSTGAQVLTPRELAEGYQPWVTKDSMKQTAPVTGGMGMHLLQKMGWVPGEGLGKEKNGSLEPLLLDVKLDKRGLVASAEEHQRQIQIQVQQQHNGRGRPRFTNVKINVDGKHPVSILGEYASKRKWNPPRYDLVHESGPGHAKNFVFKVIVNGLEYQPAISNNTKKDAKATAARFCLQQLGILQS